MCGARGRVAAREEVLTIVAVIVIIKISNLFNGKLSWLPSCQLIIDKRARFTSFASDLIERSARRGLPACSLSHGSKQLRDDANELSAIERIIGKL
jgi:hypothetical protein